MWVCGHACVHACMWVTVWACVVRVHVHIRGCNKSKSRVFKFLNLYKELSEVLRSRRPGC